MIKPHILEQVRKSFLFAFVLASSFQAANAQQLYTYNNGDNDSTPIVLTSGTDPSTLEIDSGSATQSGTISESGGSYGITKTGTGTLSLTAANTYTGATMINAGTLAIGSGGSIATSSGVVLTTI